MNPSRKLGEQTLATNDTELFLQQHRERSTHVSHSHSTLELGELASGIVGSEGPNPQFATSQAVGQKRPSLADQIEHLDRAIDNLRGKVAVRDMTW